MDMEPHPPPPLDVATAAVESIGHDEWDFAVQGGRLLQNEYARLKDTLNSEGTPDLVPLMSAFSQLFFQQRLNHVQVYWNQYLPQIQLGRSIPQDNGGHVIEINPSQPPRTYQTLFPEHTGSQEIYQNSRADRVFGIMLHQCVHAYLEVVACRGQCDDNLCWPLFVEQTGATAHRSPWIRLAAKIEKHVQIILSPLIHLSIHKSAKDEREVALDLPPIDQLVQAADDRD